MTVGRTGMFCLLCSFSFRIKHNILLRRHYSPSSLKKYRVLFFGSDEVSLTSLKEVNQLYKQDHIVKRLELVTANRSENVSFIEKYAISENLKILQWPLKDLKSHEFDIGLVVSFGHLISERVITKFPLGMVNVHTSLLPRWRGAAPVVHALLHGDTTTGVTLMSIRPHHFDIGEIIDQESINVSEDATLPQLTSELATLGASMLVRCLNTLPYCLTAARPQNEDGVTYAKKIDKSISRVKWNELSARDVYNLYRAVYGVYTLTTQFKGMEVKLLGAFVESTSRSPSVCVKEPAGTVEYSRQLAAIRVKCRDQTFVCFKRVRVVGKREITAFDFYNGYLKKSIKEECIFH